MIEKMKVVTLVTLKTDREEALESLRELGVMHVHTQDVRETADLGEVQRELEAFNRTIDALEDYEEKMADDVLPPLLLDIDPLQLVKHVNSIIDEQNWTREELNTWQLQVEQAGPWGDYDHALLQSLRARGLDIRLCAWREEDPPELPDSALVREINRVDGFVYAAIFAYESMDVNLPEMHFSSHSKSVLEDNIRICRERLDYRDHELTVAASYLPQLRDARTLYAEKAEFLRVRNAMADAERLLTLEGYVPARQIDALTASARTHGWAFTVSDPDPDDANVPTKITIPKWLEVSRPIFDFVGIQPGYNEFDISAWFLIFLSIFFAMIIGDAGYGVIILLGALAARFKVPAKLRVPCNLVAIFGGATIAWGAVTGNWFGIEESRLPGFMQALEIPWLATDANKDAHVQFICFALGAFHLSLAHTWKALIAAPHPKALSQIGWVTVLWANFLLAVVLVIGEQSHAVDFMFDPVIGGRSVTSFMIPMYLIGAALILLFSNPSFNPLKALGGGASAIIGGGINSFVDLLSYIRLFAVGLSSYYVASSFNQIGADLSGSLIGVVLAVLVIVFGHVLNLALCGLGVLVHGVRLNTLEFSGHMGMEWAGFAFRPFARRYRRGQDESA